MLTKSLSSSVPPLLELKLEALLDILHSSRSGLSTESATEALERYGLNSLAPSVRHPRLRLLASQFKSPISILLGSAALLSAVVGESFDGAVILGILMASSALGYWQELRAQSAVELLLKRLEQRTKTLLSRGEAAKGTSSDRI